VITSQGHLFTTRWVVRTSFKAVRLGPKLSALSGLPWVEDGFAGGCLAVD